MITDGYLHAPIKLSIRFSKPPTVDPMVIVLQIAECLEAAYRVTLTTEALFECYETGESMALLFADGPDVGDIEAYQADLEARPDNPLVRLPLWQDRSGQSWSMQ